MKPSGELTPGVATVEDAEVAPDMLGDDAGIPRFREYRYQTTVTRIGGVDDKIGEDRWWIVETGRVDDELKAKQKMKGSYAGTKKRLDGLQSDDARAQ